MRKSLLKFLQLFCLLREDGQDEGNFRSALSGLPRWCNGKESTCQCRRNKRYRLNLWVRKILCSSKWQATPEFLPGSFLGQRSLAFYSSRGHKEVDMAKQLRTHTSTSTRAEITEVQKVENHTVNFRKI